MGHSPLEGAPPPSVIGSAALAAAPANGTTASSKGGVLGDGARPRPGPAAVPGAASSPRRQLAQRKFERVERARKVGATASRAADADKSGGAERGDGGIGDGDGRKGARKKIATW